MTKKTCTFCGVETFHNPTSSKYTANDGQWRCTRCGYPVTTNTAKRETAERIMRKIAGRF